MKVIFINLLTGEEREYTNIDKLLPREMMFLNIDDKRMYIRNIELYVRDESFYVVRYYPESVYKLYQAEMDKLSIEERYNDKSEVKCFQDALNAVKANLYE